MGSALGVAIAVLRDGTMREFVIWVFCVTTLPWIIFGLAILGIFWRFFAPVLKVLLSWVGKLLKWLGAQIAKLFKKITSGKGGKKQ